MHGVQNDDLIVEEVQKTYQLMQKHTDLVGQSGHARSGPLGEELCALHCLPGSLRPPYETRRVAPCDPGKVL